MDKSTIQEYAISLYEATNSVPASELNLVLNNFVNLLAKKKLLHLSERIIQAFIAYAKKQAGVITIEVTSAHEIDNATLEKIKKSFGLNVEAILKTNKSLIGGIKVKTADKILDASLKTQLNSLKREMQS